MRNDVHGTREFGKVAWELVPLHVALLDVEQLEVLHIGRGRQAPFFARVRAQSLGHRVEHVIVVLARQL
eukprot:scaffold32493_cov118-Isochrysis_galbana.AAC.6